MICFTWQVLPEDAALANFLTKGYHFISTLTSIHNQPKQDKKDRTGGKKRNSGRFSPSHNH